MSTGLTAFGGIMTALYAQKSGQRGASVRVSLLETAVSLLGYHAVTWLEGGVMPRREGSGVLHLAPYQAFMCKDGYMLAGATNDLARSEEHTSELQSLMRISYAVFCLKKKTHSRCTKQLKHDEYK